MSIVIDLSPEQEAALAAKARDAGLDAERYARGVLERDLADGSPSSRTEPAPRRPISETVREILGDVPAGELAKLPSDSSNQIDHYVYGLPKRET